MDLGASTDRVLLWTLGIVCMKIYGRMCHGIPCTAMAFLEVQGLPFLISPRQERSLICLCQKS